MNPSDSTVVADTAAFLLVGNELLTGKIQERNLYPLAQTLRALGVTLVWSSIVRDDPHTIACEVKRLSALADVVFTSGGIGPTHDDVTIEAVALAFDVPAVTPAHLAARLREVYGAGCTEAHLRMALVPQGAALLTEDETESSWPLIRMHNVWILPGIPELFRSKLTIVRRHLRGQLLKEHLDAVVAEHPDVEIGSYPKWFSEEYKTKVTFDAQSPELVVSALQSLLARLPNSAISAVSLPETSVL
jgi:molybdenum cofactor synthesis domain-containing protein